MYKTQISRVSALFALLAMLSGCGEKEMTGQIFVVTQAKDNIKLALVAVGAIPQEEFDPFLKAKQSEKQKKQQYIYSYYVQAKAKLEKIASGDSAETAQYNWNKILIEHGGSDVPKAKKENDEIDVNRAVALTTVATYEAYDKAEFLLEGIPQPKFISKTDADGQFTLTLPKGKYVITANSSRAVFGSSETYHWLVMVDTSNINQPLMLSNDNLLETKCNECVKF